MKLIKCMIKKHRTPIETSFQYPENWDAQKINVLAYENSEKMGDVEEYCIGIIHDDNYAEKLIASSSDIENIDEEEANILVEKARPHKLMVDEQRLPEILLAISKSPNERDTNEKKMLDPEDDTVGIRYTEKFNVRRWFPDECETITPL